MPFDKTQDNFRSAEIAVFPFNFLGPKTHSVKKTAAKTVKTAKTLDSERRVWYSGDTGQSTGVDGRSRLGMTKGERRKRASKEVAVYEGDSGVERTPGQVKRIKSKVANDLHRKVSMSRMRLPAAPWASPGD